MGADFLEKNQTHKCEKCDKRFFYKRNAARHKRSNCDRDRRQKKTKRAPTKYKKAKRPKCEYCHFEGENFGAVRKHVQNDHQDKYDEFLQKYKKQKCPQCEAKFSSKYCLHRH